MKILYIAPDYYSSINNAKLIVKLLPWLVKNNDVHILTSVANIDNLGQLPKHEGCTYHIESEEMPGIIKKMISQKKNLIVKFLRKERIIEQVLTHKLIIKAKKLHDINQYDLILSTCFPNRGVCAAIRISSKAKKILYMMDPPAWFLNTTSQGTFLQRKRFNAFLDKTHLILTTPFIREALSKHYCAKYDNKIIEVGFPMLHPYIYKPDANDVVMDPLKINLLFCGWLYSDIRSPKYFLDIVSRLDERFCIYFMGKECDKLRERFDIQTKAQIVTLPLQPYQTALNAMHDADILINIGNSVPVHMPSKTLEYINTGKPIVNFHKMPDCTTLYYTNRYPLCLNLAEYDDNVDKAAESFIEFCTANKGKTTDTAGLAEQFRDCTPEYIANIILEHLGAPND